MYVAGWCGYGANRLFGRGGSEVGGSPEIPGGDGAEGLPAAGAAEHEVGFGEIGWGDFGGGFKTEEGEGEAFADAVVVDGEEVGAAEGEHEEHLDGPFSYAPDLRQVLDQVVVGHAAGAGEGGDGAVEGFCGKVAEGEGFVGGEAGGAELLVGAVEELLRGGVGAEEVYGVGVGGEGLDHAVVDGGSGLSVELLINDGADEGLEGGGAEGKAEGDGADAVDEAGEFRVGGLEVGDGFGGEGELASAAGEGGHGGMIRGRWVWMIMARTERRQVQQCGVLPVCQAQGQNYDRGRGNSDSRYGGPSLRSGWRPWTEQRRRRGRG